MDGYLIRTIAMVAKMTHPSARCRNLVAQPRDNSAGGGSGREASLPRGCQNSTPTDAESRDGTTGAVIAAGHEALVTRIRITDAGRWTLKEGVVSAVLAARHMPAERHRAAALDCTHHLQLVEANVPGIGFAPRRPVVAEDIRNLQC
jgi:hypothetical protein